MPSRRTRKPTGSARATLGRPAGRCKPPPRTSSQTASFLELATSRPARERPAERHLVRVLEVAADGKTAREPRHAHPVRAGGRRGRPRSPRRSCSGSSRARPPRRRPRRLGAAARRSAGAPARRRRAARASRRARGRGRGTRASARARSRRPAARRRRRRVRSRRASAQIAQSSSSVRLPHSRQKRTRSFTSSIARRERERLVRAAPEEVEREPLRRPRADAGQARQLRDEVVDRRAEHGVRLSVRFGHALGCGTSMPGQPEAARAPPGSMPSSFDSTSACAERSASFTAARTRSASSSGSSGSIAFGSIVISTISPPPFALP